MENRKNHQSQNETTSKENTEEKNRIRIVLAGGGTGGHIYPAIGIAQALHRIDKHTDIVFIGGRDRIEASVVPQQGFRFLPISVEGFPRRVTWKWFPVIFRVFQGLLKSFKYLKELQPDVVIGTGGYVSGPVLYAASLLGIPIAIQEQNATPGLTNRILARRAKAAFLALPQETKGFPNHIVQVTGNPIRPNITNFPRRKETYEKYGLSETKKTVFVLGGSQGAQAVNKVMIDACPLIAQLIKCDNSQENTNGSQYKSDGGSISIQIVHQTGKKDIDKVRESYQKHAIPCLVQSFFDPIEEIYSIADLMICRAGGMTVSEVTACGIPAIFIPLPAAVGNDQVQNAKTVADVRAAVVIRQENITPEKLVKQLSRILSDDTLYKEMKVNSSNLGKPFASDTIAESILRLAADDIT